MDQIATELTDAMAAAYAPLVRGRLAEREVECVGIEAALAEGEAWLRSELSALLRRSFEQQARSPLEVFQEAMRFPTSALETAGVPNVARDEAAEAALPGDRFDLAPASSMDLGEPAWRAHIAWGASKAAGITRPAVVLVSADLMDRSRVEPTVEAAGFRLVMWRSAEDVGGGRLPAVVFVDVTHRHADAIISAASSAGMRVVGFGPHVDEFALTRARTLGAAEVLPRSRFFTSIGRWLPEIV